MLVRTVGRRLTRRDGSGVNDTAQVLKEDPQQAHLTGRPRSLRQSLGAAAGALLGLVPHVLHHVGLLVGTALFVGAGGNLVLYLLGLLMAVPLLRRLRRRFSTWLAPAIAVVVFTAAFAVSAFVIGPAISGGGAAGSPPSPSSPARVGQHGPAGPATPGTPSAPASPVPGHEGHHT